MQVHIPHPREASLLWGLTCVRHGAAPHPHGPRGTNRPCNLSRVTYKVCTGWWGGSTNLEMTASCRRAAPSPGAGRRAGLSRPPVPTAPTVSPRRHFQQPRGVRGPAPATARSIPALPEPRAELTASRPPAGPPAARSVPAAKPPARLVAGAGGGRGGGRHTGKETGGGNRVAEACPSLPASGAAHRDERRQHLAAPRPHAASPPEARALPDAAPLPPAAPPPRQGITHVGPLRFRGSAGASRRLPCPPPPVVSPARRAAPPLRRSAQVVLPKTIPAAKETAPAAHARRAAGRGGREAARPRARAGESRPGSVRQSACAVRAVPWRRDGWCLCACAAVALALSGGGSGLGLARKGGKPAASVPGSRCVSRPGGAPCRRCRPLLSGACEGSWRFGTFPPAVSGGAAGGRREPRSSSLEYPSR